MWVLFSKWFENSLGNFYNDLRNSVRLMAYQVTIIEGVVRVATLFLIKNPSTFQYILLRQKTDYQYISVHFKQKIIVPVEGMHA